MQKAFYEAFRILWDAVCLMAFSSRRQFHPLVNQPALAVIAIIYAVLFIASDIPYLTTEWYFNEYGLSTIFAQLAVAAAIASTAVFAGCPARRILAYSVAYMTVYIGGISVVLLPVYAIYRLYPQLSVVPFYVVWLSFSIWILIGAFRAGARIGTFAPKASGAISLAAVLGAFILVPNTQVIASYDSSDSRSDIWYFARAYWTPPVNVSSEAAVAKPEYDWEQTFYNQPRLIKSLLDSLIQTDKVKPNAYFLGLAPYANQAVFAREVRASRDIFDKHFKTEGRSAILLNSEVPSDTIPIASTGNLKNLAAGLKSKINGEKDIVVLFITSHGSQDLISVNQYPLPLNQIKPDDIKEALNATSALNRIVIISACYSGSFINDLKDEHTTILTASREDRTSFGCSNERDWTFFTNALFNHGFRQSRDIRKAFAIASELVGSWEKRQDLTASLPQIFIGKEVESAWQKMMPDFDQSISESLLTPETAETLQEASVGKAQ
jgi:hypothetical protein